MYSKSSPVISAVVIIRQQSMITWLIAERGVLRAKSSECHLSEAPVTSALPTEYCDKLVFAGELTCGPTCWLGSKRDAAVAHLLAGFDPHCLGGAAQSEILQASVLENWLDYTRCSLDLNTTAKEVEVTFFHLCVCLSSKSCRLQVIWLILSLPV